jgi:hypothetical protein
MPARSSGWLDGRIAQPAMPASCMTHEEIRMPNGRPIAARTTQQAKTARKQHPRHGPYAKEPDHQPARCFGLDQRFVADGDHNSRDGPAKPPQKEMVPPLSHLTPKFQGVHYPQPVRLTSNSTELHIPASQHISQHIAARGRRGMPKLRRAHADLRKPRPVVSRDTQIWIFTYRCHKPPGGGVTDPGPGRRGSSRPLGRG